MIMRRLIPLVALAILCIVVPAQAQEATNPIRYTWIASSCDTWNCAAAALVMANGEPSVIVLPTGREDRPWIVLRRVEEGSVFIPEDEPYACEVFETVTSASSMFSTMDPCHGPLMLNVPDGRAVIASLSQCGEASPRRRSAGR